MQHTVVEGFAQAAMGLPSLLRALTAEDPRHTVGGRLPGLALAAFALAWVVCYTQAWGLVVCARTYRVRSGHGGRRAAAALDVADAPTTRCVRLGPVRIIQGRRAPAIVFSASPPFLLRCQSAYTYSGDLNTEVHVLRWAWHGPLVPDPAPTVRHDRADASAPDNTVTVLERVSNDDHTRLEEFTEVALPRGMPDDARQRAATAAAEMLEVCGSGGGEGRVLLLQGPPGWGKSCAVRDLARRLRAVLYADYDPTRPGECLMRLVSLYGPSTHAPSGWLVVAIEEADWALRTIASGRVPALSPPPPQKQQQQHADPACCDAYDKPSWNKLLDRVKRKCNVVLVLTTNLDDAGLLDACGGDASYLRPGRVDRRIRCCGGVADDAALQPTTPPPEGEPTPRDGGLRSHPVTTEQLDL